MKKSLFPETGRFYKANLHNHTVVSDGGETPEAIKKIYQEKGYDIVAYSDHEVMVNHEDLTDEHFLALTAFEYEFNEKLPEGVPPKFRKTYHLVSIAPKSDMREYPWANPAYLWGNTKQYAQSFYVGDKTHNYTFEDVNGMISEAHRLGFLVTYCHPQWSLQHYPDYAGIENVDFVETFNNSCVAVGYGLDACEYVMNDFLCLGKRISPTASDDGHAPWDYCGGATYIKAASLRYEDIFDALKKKNVYASWGPEIHDISFDPETGELSVESSDAREILLTTGCRFAKRAHAEAGETISAATFKIKSYLADCALYDLSKCFVRITVIDREGRRALSRGYFVDELLAL